MNPEIWGRSLWDSIHHIAAGYPVKPSKIQKKEYCLFFNNLANVLPCHTCSVSFKKHLKELPIRKYLKSRKRLVYWTFLIHNKVNKKLKKRVRISWGTVYKKYVTLSYSPKMVK